MISTGNNRHGIALFLGSSVGSDLMKADELKRIGTSRLTTDATRVVPDLDLELWCTARKESSGVYFQSSEFRLTHDAAIIKIPVIRAGISAHIVWKTKKIRKFTRYQ